VGLQYSGKTTFVNVIAVSRCRLLIVLIFVSLFGFAIMQHLYSVPFHQQSGQFSEDMIPTVGFNMRKVSKGNVTIKVSLQGEVI